MKEIEEYRYQVVFMGDDSSYKDTVKEKLEENLLENKGKLLLYCSPADIDFRLPAVGVYFGKEGYNEMDATDVRGLLSKGIPVLPVVENLVAFKESVPKELAPYNGVEVRKEDDCKKIVTYLLYEFRLVRGKKKIFISYCRKDADRFAHRLHDELVHRKYDVFLDSYSIEDGRDFQAELQEYLADSDVMVFFHSPESANSRWVQEELTKANRLQIGVVEVQWPDYAKKNTILEPGLTYPILLNDREVCCPFLQESVCIKVADAVEHWRIRSIQSRIVNLKLPLLSELKKELGQITIHPSSVVTLEGNTQKKIYVPIVGLPCAMDYHETAELFLKGQKKTTDSWVVYDCLCFQKKNMEHLEWLGKHLPVKSKNIRKYFWKKNMRPHPSEKIFLSASIPSVTKGSQYYQKADIIAIRDAVRALAATVLPYVNLIWGGHPTITPLIKEVLEGVGITPAEIKEHVTLYQSGYFEKDFPEDNNYVENIQLTDVVLKDTDDKTQKASLEEMRQCMFGEHSYAAGIFIGGMEGVEKEFEFFKKYHPYAFCIPVASTGGAALKLFELGEKSSSEIVLPEGFDRQRLKKDFDYQSLFQDLFEGIVPNSEWL